MPLIASDLVADTLITSGPAGVLIATAYLLLRATLTTLTSRVDDLGTRLNNVEAGIRERLAALEARMSG